VSGWTPWRRDHARELPGSLCDETPQSLSADGPAAAEVGKWQPRRDDEHQAPAPTAVLLAAQQARTIGEADAAHRQLENNYLAVCQQLREVTADRNALDEANGVLVDRIRGLEETVRALAARDGDTLHAHDHGGNLIAPWPAQQQN